MLERFPGFLYQVGSEIKFLISLSSRNDYIHGSLASTLKSPSKVTCSYSDEYKSKFLRNASRRFMMLFLFELSEQLRSHFLLWKLNSIYKPSIGLLSADKNLTGISPDKNHNSSTMLITIQAERGDISRNSKLANWKGLIEFTFWNN